MRKMFVTAKCNDMCNINVPHLGLSKQGYIPSDIGIGGGDYINLEIDLDTGLIVNWSPLSDKQICKFLEKQ